MNVHRLLAAAVCIALVACGGAVSNSGEDGLQVQWQRDYAKGGASSTSPLVDHGGRVLPTSKTYAIWWGPSTSFPSDVQTGVHDFFGHVGTAGGWEQGVLGPSNYMRGAAASSSFVADDFDGSTPPSKAPSTSTIANEVCKAINAKGWTADPSAIYFVFTSNFPSHVGYCAWHSSGTCNGVTISTAYMPNTTGVAGCDPGTNAACTTSQSYSQGTRSVINVTSHEFMEAVTDAVPGSATGAWTDASGNEIGDKCAWTFNGCANLAGEQWMIQQEWSNAANGCVQN